MVWEGMLIAGRHQWFSWPTLPDNPPFHNTVRVYGILSLRQIIV